MSIDLKTRYDIGWYSAYETLKGMIVLYGFDKVKEAIAEIEAAQVICGNACTKEGTVVEK